MTDWTKTDALIFDMDGTLWDAVDSYCQVWDTCFSFFGDQKTVCRKELVDCMGLPLDEIYRRIAGQTPAIKATTFIPALEKLEKEMMPRLGGCPYPGMQEGIKSLSRHYQIFLLSNCGVNGLSDMMRHTGITPFVREAVTFGATRSPKHRNMKMLQQRHNLIQPVYIGDTESDCRQTRIAGFPFIFASYGFGTCENPDLSFQSFDELTDFFLKIKKQ